MRTVLAVPAALTSFIPVDLDKLTASSFVHHVAPGPKMLPAHLLVDCGHMRCLRHLGVSHVVSQLLALHQSGARVFLCNVDPLLHRCLRLLRLDALFIVL